jgi:hypothetical protein
VVPATYQQIQRLAVVVRVVIGLNGQVVPTADEEKVAQMTLLNQGGFGGADGNSCDL